MDKNVMSQLDAELEHAGEETTLSPKMLLLEQLRITPEKLLKPMEFLFQLFGKPCFPRRELVAITGKAKSGKTFVTSMLMAVGSLTPNPSPKGEGSICQLPLKRMHEEPLHVLWYDTEQSDESTQDILNNRIIPMMSNGNDATTPLALWRGAGGEAFNVRAVPWKERRDLLREAVTRCKPDLVIVDGIRDLVNDINDGVLAQEVMEELMHLATEHNCCIVCVLHQNKSGEDHNLRIFKLEQTQTRKYDIERPMYYEVGEDGLPKASPLPPPTGGGDLSREQLPQLNREYKVTEDDGGWHMDVRRLFGDVLSGHDQITGSELRDEVCRRGNIVSWKFYNSLLNKAIDEKVIMKSFDHVGHVIYTMAPF